MGVVIRQSFKGTVLTYLGAFLGFVTQFFVVTKYLSPDVIGLTKVFYEVGSLFAGLGLLGITASGMRFFPYFKNSENGNNGFFFYYLVIPLIGTTVISLLYLILREPILQIFASKSSSFSDFFYLVIPLIFVLVLWQAMETYSNINMKIAFPKGVRELCLRIFLLADYMCFAYGFLDLQGLMISILAAYGLCLVMDFMYVKKTSSVSLKHESSFVTPDLKNKFIKYSGFLVLSALTGNIVNQLDILMLSSVSGLYSAGIYTIAFFMANVIDMPSRSITSISSPIAAEALKSGDFKKANSLYQSVSIHQLMISSVIFLIIWVNLDNIYSIIPNGDKFAEGRYVVLFLGLSKIITSTLNFGGILIQFSRYYYWTLFITLFLTVLTIFTNLYLIPRMGVSGAALATLIATILSHIYQQYLVQRKVHGNPFTSKTLIMLFIVIALWAINNIIPSLSEISPWLDIAFRSCVLLIIGYGMILKFKISSEISRITEGLVESFIKK